MPRYRSANAAYPVLGSVRTRGLRPVKRISVERGLKMVEAGRLLPLFDRSGRLASFRMIEPKAPTSTCAKRVEELPCVRPVTAHESRLNAGVFGESKTSGLTEDERQWLKARGLIEAEEDEVELAQVKVATCRTPPRVHVVVAPVALL